ncbi:MAG: hypothetical protein ACR2JY_16515 [Chloroflexota bacterium]
MGEGPIVIGDPILSARLTTQTAPEQERLDLAFYSVFIRAHKPGA